MKEQVVVVNGVERRVRREPDGVCRIDGFSGRASTASTASGVRSVLVDGEQFEVVLSSSGEGRYTAQVGGRSFDVEVVDPRRLARGAARLSAEGSRTVAAPMPGKIVDVKVEPGDAVAAGQGVVVVEAMKMQNELKAPKDGTVGAVKVVAGDSVGAGDALVVIE